MKGERRTHTILVLSHFNYIVGNNQFNTKHPSNRFYAIHCESDGVHIRSKPCHRISCAYHPENSQLVAAKEISRSSCKANREVLASNERSRHHPETKQETRTWMLRRCRFCGRLGTGSSTWSSSLSLPNRLRNLLCKLPDHLASLQANKIKKKLLFCARIYFACVPGHLPLRGGCST